MLPTILEADQVVVRIVSFREYQKINIDVEKVKSGDVTRTVEKVQHESARNRRESVLGKTHAGDDSCRR